MKNLKAELHFMRWTLLYIGIWFLVWGGMTLAIHESVVDLFVKNADTPTLLLEGYCKQTLWLYITAILAIVIIIAFAVVTFFFQIKEELNPKNRLVPYGVSPSLLIILFASFVWAPIIMQKDVKLTEQYAQIQEDLAAVKEGSLKSDLVFLNSHSDREDFIPFYGKYSKYRDTVTCYHATGAKESRNNLPAWQKIYVPDCLHFNMDMEHAYNEWETLKWNESHSDIFRITYTPNLHFVVSIEVESQGENET